MTAPERTWTMRDVVRILEVPKYRIIYFCNAQVVRPFKDAIGRGKVRRFSARNLLEFSLAVTLLDSDVPTSHAQRIVVGVGKFEASMRKLDPSFRIPSALAADGAPELRAVIGDGRYLSFVLNLPDGKSKVSSVSLDLRSGSKARSPSPKKEIRAHSPSGMAIVDGRKVREFGQPEGSRFVRTEVGVTQIAQNLAKRLARFDIEVR